MMECGETVLVSCTIGSGAFSGERVFRLTMGGAGGEYSGVAPVRYCLNANQERLGKNEPTSGSEIGGFVEALLVANGGEEATVELPNGDVIPVSLRAVPFRQSATQDSKYVPV
jgi:hypothetical protein